MGETVAAGHHYRVRRIDMLPGAELDLRVDHHRTGQYVVLSGEALITRGDDVIHAGPQASIFVPFGVPHRLENAGRDTLSLLEVQLGSASEEDDDFYGDYGDFQGA
jgi:mannose-1-phosphate guanylyltransferase/mannose-6-phosphate isomerase